MDPEAGAGAVAAKAVDRFGSARYVMEQATEAINVPEVPPKFPCPRSSLSPRWSHERKQPRAKNTYQRCSCCVLPEPRPRQSFLIDETVANGERKNQYPFVLSI